MGSVGGLGERLITSLWLSQAILLYTGRTSVARSSVLGWLKVSGFPALRRFELINNDSSKGFISSRDESQAGTFEICCKWAGGCTQGLNLPRLNGELLRSSVVRESEFKSQDPGFDPLAGQGEAQFFPVPPPSQLLRRQK